MHPDVGEFFFQLADGLVDPLGHCHRVGAGILVDHEAYGGLAVQQRFGVWIRSGERNGGEVGELDAGAGGPNRRLADFLGCAEFREGAHREAELAAPDGAARRAPVGVLDCRGNLIGIESECAHSLRINLDPDLILGRAYDRDARDAVELLQAAAVHVARGVGNGAEVAGAGEREHRNGALTGIAGEECGSIGAFRQRTARVVQPLAHGEHRARHVGAPGKARRGGHLAVPAHAPEVHQARRCRDGLLDRLGDEA